MRRHSTALSRNVFGSYWGIRYGLPEKITSIIQNSYEGLTCSEMHNGQLTVAFPVRIGVRQVVYWCLSCSSLRSTGLWNNPHHNKEMEYDGHRSRNWTTWILLTIWFSCPTPKSRCKKRPILGRLGLNWISVILSHTGRGSDSSPFHISGHRRWHTWRNRSWR